MSKKLSPKREKALERLVKALLWIDKHPSWLATRPNVKELAERHQIYWKSLEIAINLRARGY